MWGDCERVQNERADMGRDESEGSRGERDGVVGFHERCLEAGASRTSWLRLRVGARRAAFQNPCGRGENMQTAHGKFREPDQREGE